MNYSILFNGRTEGFEKFGPIFKQPIIRSAYDYLKKTYQGGRLLDVGAGTEFIVQKLLNLDDTLYHTLDNDPTGNFTYAKVDQIPKDLVYDWIVMNQLIEHLTISQGTELLQVLHHHLKPGGCMLLTTPNIFHPIRYWGDPTHITPWGHNALYGLLTVCDYQVKAIFRYSKNRGPVDPFSWVLERFMRHIYRIDWCDSILVTATRD